MPSIKYAGNPSPASRQECSHIIAIGLLIICESLMLLRRVVFSDWQSVSALQGFVNYERLRPSIKESDAWFPLIYVCLLSAESACEMNTVFACLTEPSFQRLWGRARQSMQSALLLSQVNKRLGSLAPPPPKQGSGRPTPASTWVYESNSNSELCQCHAFPILAFHSPVEGVPRR